MSYRKGAKAEHRTMALLEAAGYEVCRSAGSHSVVDVCAWNTTGFRLIQVKATGRGTGASPAEREALALLVKPANATVEVWRWKTYARQPVIEVLS